MRGLSTGGRVYGYRTIDAEEKGRRAITIDDAEAAVVRRIFRDYAEGRSLRTIAHALNKEGVAHPMKPTRRGPMRKGWAVTSIRFILRNERYMGRVTWNRREFLKDPDTGKRRSVERPRASGGSNNGPSCASSR